MRIENFLLMENGIEFIPSPNNGGKFKAGYPDTIILHYTAGPSAESAINTFKDPQNQVSAHIVLGEKGDITQMVPFDEIAWHAGVSSYEGRSGFNKYSIGIEIVNPGHLNKVGDKYQAWFGKKYDESEVIYAVHRNESEPRYWKIYTEEQITKVMELCRLLVREYNIKYILGHEEIAPERKLDPGPALPLNKIRDRILNNRRDDTDDFSGVSGKVTASKVNIRANADITFNKIAKPLEKGTSVKILDTKNGWYKVKTEITGWIYGKYIEIEN